MKTILITGINGFLGSHLAKGLSKDYKIVGLEYSVRNLFRLKMSSIINSFIYFNAVTSIKFINFL